MMKLQHLFLFVVGAIFRPGLGQNSFRCTDITRYLSADHICRVTFPSNTWIMVPNPEQTHFHQRNFKTSDIQGSIDESAGAANLYYNLLGNCSENALSLVCQYYFPTCVFNEGVNKPVYPCLEECEELTSPNHECGKKLRGHPTASVAKQFLGCNATYFFGSVKETRANRSVYVPEANAAALGRFCANFSKKEPDTPVTTEAPLVTTEAPLVTTEAPCLDFSSKLPESNDLTQKCRNRKIKIFDELKLHSKIRYLINCTITEVLVDDNAIFLKNAIKCRTNHFFSVMSKSACSDASLPTGTEVYILGYHSTKCEKTSVKKTFLEGSVGKTYIIAGSDQITHCNQKFLYFVHRSFAVEHAEGVSIPMSSNCPHN